MRGARFQITPCSFKCFAVNRFVRHLQPLICQTHTMEHKANIINLTYRQVGRKDGEMLNKTGENLPPTVDKEVCRFGPEKVAT